MTERGQPTAKRGRPAGAAGVPDDEAALPEVVVAASRRELAGRGMSQKTLAGRLGMTETTISRWLNRQQGVPLRQIVRVAEVLGVALGVLFSGQAGPVEDAQLLNERVLHRLADGLEAQTREYQALRASLRAIPLYRTGAPGDPRRGEGDPQAARATSFAYRPPGTEQTIGPRGFAVVVDGEEVAGRGVRPGDVAFCNPDCPWAEGSLVVVGLGGPAGGDAFQGSPGPLALRELVYGPTRTLDARTAPEGAPPVTHPAGAYTVYGPAVAVLTVVLLPEGRGHAEGAHRLGPGPSPEARGGTPIEYSSDPGRNGDGTRGRAGVVLPPPGDRR